MNKKIISSLLVLTMAATITAASAQEEYFWKVYSVANSGGNSGTLIVADTTPITLVKEDWSGNFRAENYYFWYNPDSIDTGYGWASRWSPSETSVTDFTEGHYVAFAGSMPYDKGNQDIDIIYKNNLDSVNAFWSNGQSIYRDLYSPISLTEENEFYLKWYAFNAQQCPEDKFAGVMFNGIKLGFTRYDETGLENRIAIGTPDGITYGDKTIPFGNNPSLYVAKITIDPSGEDTVSLKSYYYGIDAQDYPDDWDVVVNCELEGDSINNFAYSSYSYNGGNTYQSGINLYKPQSSVTLEETENYIKSLLNILPDSDKITVSDIDKYSEEINMINDALTWYDLNIENYDTEGKYTAYQNKVVDNIKISTPVNIRNDMHARIYNFSDGQTDANATLASNPNYGWNPDEVKSLPGWENDWSTVQGLYNIMNINGIKYELKVDTAIVSSQDGQALTTTYDPENLYFEYDIDNGYYTSVNLLASIDNSYYTNFGIRSQFGIILVYEDGTKEVKTNTIYGATEDKSSTGMQQMSSKLWTSLNGAVTPETMGYAHVYEFETDTSKKLDKIQILKAYTAINEEGTDIDYDNGLGGMYWTYYATSEEPYVYENENGEEIQTTLGEYLMSVYAPGSQNSASVYKTYGNTNRANILAVSLVNTIADSKNNIIDIISGWPEEPTSEDAQYYNEQFNNVTQSIISMTEAGSDVSEIETNEKYLAMKRAISMMSTVPVFADISSQFNQSAYASQKVHDEGIGQNPVLTAGPNTGFELEDMKALPNWKYDWNTISDDFNKLILGDTEFNVKVTAGVNPDTKNIIYNGLGTNDGDIELDMPDGNYESVSFLATNYTQYFSSNMNTSYLGIYLNYTDGTREFKYQELYPSSMDMSGSMEQIGVQRIGNNSDNTWHGIYEGQKLYAHRYDFETDYSRTLDSITILNQCNVLVDGSPVPSSEYRDFTSVVFAVTLNQYMSDYLADIKAQVEPMIEALPEEITADDKEAFLAIKAIIDEAVEYGIDTADIVGYEKYDAVKYNFTEISSISKNSDFDNVTINVQLTLPTKIENITKETVVLYEGTEPSDQSYIVETQNVDNGVTDSFKVIVPNDLGGKDYSVKMDIGYMISYNYRFKSGSPVKVTSKAYNSEDRELTYICEAADDLLRINVDIVSQIDTDYVSLIAIYDENGSLYEVVYENGSITNGADSLETYVEIPGHATELWGYKVMVWNNLEDMKPIAEAYENFTYGKTYGYDNVIDTARDLNVVYFGDSQTEGQMFTQPLTELLTQNRTGKVNAYTMGLGGTDSETNIRKKKKDVLAYEPDLVFVEFAPNDANYVTSSNNQPERVLGATEGIVRQLLTAKHEPVIIFLNPMVSDNRETYNATVLDLYSQVLENYGNIGLIDFNAYADTMAQTDSRYEHSNLTSPSDGVHFTQAGGTLFAQYIYDRMINGDVVKKAVFTENCVSDCNYVNPDYVSCLEGGYDDNWADVVLDTSLEGYGTSTNSYPHYMQTIKSGASLTFTFTGTTIGFYNLIGPEGSTYSYVIDNNISGTGAVTANTSYRYKNGSILKKNLDEGEHTITITNTGADGKELGIAYFIVDER